MLYMPRLYAASFCLAFNPERNRVVFSFDFRRAVLCVIPCVSPWYDNENRDGHQYIELLWPTSELFQSVGCDTKFGIGEHGCEFPDSADHSRTSYHDIGDATNQEKWLHDDWR